MVVQLHQTACAENLHMRIARSHKFHLHYSTSCRLINYVSLLNNILQERVYQSTQTRLQ